MNQSYTGLDNLDVMAHAHNYNRFLVDQVKSAAQGSRRALDFGAGLGAFATVLRNSNVEVTTIETDPELQTKLRSLGFEVGNRIDEIKNREFDLIYSLNVLEHIDDDENLLIEFANIMKPGGRLYLYVPAFQMLWTSMDTKVKHVRRYTRRELEDKLKRAGFEIEQSGYCDSIGFFATLVYKIIGSSKGDINLKSLKFFDRYLFPLNKLLDPLLKNILGKNAHIVGRLKPAKQV